MNTELITGNLYCLVYKKMSSALIEYMENKIFDDFYDFKLLGTIYLPSNVIFKDKDTKEVLNKCVIYSEPFIILEKYEKSDAVFILQTNNGESTMGYIFVSYKAKPLCFEEYLLYGRLP